MSNPTINLALEFTSGATEARTAREWATLEFNTNLFQLANDAVSASGYRFMIADMFAGSTADFMRCNNQAGTTVFSIGSAGSTKVSGLRTAIATKSATYTVTVNDHTLLGDAIAAGFDFDLPAAATCTGQIFVLAKIDDGANVVSIDPNGSEQIDGAGAGVALDLTTENHCATIQSTGTGWKIISFYQP